MCFGVQNYLCSNTSKKIEDKIENEEQDYENFLSKYDLLKEYQSCPFYGEVSLYKQHENS